MVAYDNGYSKEFSTCSVREWSEKIHQEIMAGTSLNSIGTNIHRKVLSQTDTIELEHPGYLHFLFRDAVKKKGSNAGYDELAAQMVLSSSGIKDHRPPITLSPYQLSK